MSKIGKTIVTLGVVAGLGVACLPLSSYAADHVTGDSEDLEVVLNVKDSISLEIKQGTNTADGSFIEAIPEGEGGTPAAQNAILNLGEFNADGSLKEGSVKAIVSTTHITGYELTIVGNGTGTDKTSMVNENGAEIKTLQTGETDLTANMTGGSRWAYKAGAATTYSAIPSTAATLDSSNTSVKKETNITFGVTVAEGQEEGEYKGIVTLTATANELNP